MADVAKFSKLDASAVELMAAWQDRLVDASALLKAGRYAAAIYSGIYALEILLKTRICQTLNVTHMPRIFEIHDLYGLATSAGLRQAIDDPTFKASLTGQRWLKVLDDADRLNELRYSPNANSSLQDAADFLDRLQDPKDGVIPWIQRQP
jgi:hypothetical protein